MKSTYCLFAFVLGTILLSWNPAPDKEITTPFSDYHAAWNHAKYQASNTAINTTYLTSDEKEMIYILNLIRQYPKQFKETILAQWPALSHNRKLANSTYYKSLVKTLDTMKPVGILEPDELAWKSALCHAKTSGKTGYVGHDRQTTTCQNLINLRGECCHYGFEKPIDVVLSLLIDENVPSLGHRKIMLSGNYQKVGISKQPHKTYRTNTVMDFL